MCMRPRWGGCVAHLVPASLRVAPCRTPPPLSTRLYLWSTRVEHTWTDRVTVGTHEYACGLELVATRSGCQQSDHLRSSSKRNAHATQASSRTAARPTSWKERAPAALTIYLESDRVYVTNTRDVSCVEQRWGAHRGFRALQFSKHIDNASISPGICIDGPQSPRSGVCVALRRCFDQSLTCAHTLRTTSTLAQK